MRKFKNYEEVESTRALPSLPQGSLICAAGLRSIPYLCEQGRIGSWPAGHPPGVQGSQRRKWDSCGSLLEGRELSG